MHVFLIITSPCVSMCRCRFLNIVLCRLDSLYMPFSWLWTRFGLLHSYRFSTEWRCRSSSIVNGHSLKHTWKYNEVSCSIIGCKSGASSAAHCETKWRWDAWQQSSGGLFRLESHCSFDSNAVLLSQPFVTIMPWWFVFLSFSLAPLLIFCSLSSAL